MSERKTVDFLGLISINNYKTIIYYKRTFSTAIRDWAVDIPADIVFIQQFSKKDYIE